MSTIRLATGATVESPSTDHLLAVAQREIDRLAVGERAPARPVVDDAAVERAMDAWDRADRNTVIGYRALLRVALAAALEGRG